MELSNLDINIKKAKNILLVSHINPDGDTLGSMCALYPIIWNNYKKKCDMVAVSQIPEVYKFLPGIELVKNIEEIDNSRVYDLVINVDVASLDRCGDAQVLFNKASVTANIDHHGTNDSYANLNFIDSKAAATAELITKIATELNWKLDKDSATCLYTGIMTDTGCFKYSNTTSDTFELAGKLLNYEISPSEIAQRCYDSNPKDMVLFQSYCLSKAKFEECDTIGYTTVYKKDLEKYNYNGDDFTEGLVEKIRAIKTIVIAFVIKELSPPLSQLSMRCKVTHVAKICVGFGGGGHKFAAGSLIKTGVKQATKLVLEEIYNAKKNIKK